MRGSHACEAPALGFDHGAEVIAAVGTLLLQPGAERGEVFVVEHFGQQLAIGSVACDFRGAQRVLDRVQREERVRPLAAEGSAAGPAERCRIICHLGAYWVEIDVSHASKQVFRAVDEAGFVASFPQRTAVAMPRVEQADGAPPELLHYRADRAGL